MRRRRRDEDEDSALVLASRGSAEKEESGREGTRGSDDKAGRRDFEGGASGPLASFLVCVPTECTTRGSVSEYARAVVSQDVAEPLASAGGPKRRKGLQRTENEILVTMFAKARACPAATQVGRWSSRRNRSSAPKSAERCGASPGTAKHSDSGNKGKGRSGVAHCTSAHAALISD